MRFLAIETSCDETSLAIFSGRKMLAHLVASQMELHATTGGVVPEVASRAHLEIIFPLLERLLSESKMELSDLKAVAVTSGPGLLGALLVGAQLARTLGSVLSIPVYPINHLEGHLYANFVDKTYPMPAVAMIVSGGHTMLVLMRGHGRYKLLGETVDDAAGEAFDKVAKTIGLGYPGGPAIQKAALGGDRSRFKFPRGMIHSGDLNFSFSGLKTAVLNVVKDMGKLSTQDQSDLAASFQFSVTDVLASKTRTAISKYRPTSLFLGGGVAANLELRETFKAIASENKLSLSIPPINLCTDNAAMIGLAAYFRMKSGVRPKHFEVKSVWAMTK